MYRVSKDYIEGLKDGIRMYAHWKDGTEYVGTTGRSLKKALEEIDKEYISYSEDDIDDNN